MSICKEIDLWVKEMLVAREELGKLVQKIKEKQEKVRDNANLGDTGPRQQAFLQLPWHCTILNWRLFPAHNTVIVIQFYIFFVN